MSARDRLLLALLVALRLSLMSVRLLENPRRYWNFEEAYNASVAWAIANAGLGEHLLSLQYRSFCGGCTVVGALGAPLLALADRFLLWKLLALLWAAATMILGFQALDRLVGRAAAWAFAILCAVPALGAADLSLMLWGNHQETALFGVLALWMLSRGRGLGLGLTLGLGVWFCRTALYPAVVLLPAALVLLRGDRRRVLVGFALGLAPLLLPAAEGDAGFYRMEAALGQPLDAMGARLATLLLPGPLAERLYLPLGGMAPAGAAWLLAAGVAALLIVKSRNHLIFFALPLSYALFYAVTRFPLFHVHSRVPLNNIRYHSPWAFALTLLVAAGVGLAWARGRRRLAVALLLAPLLANGAGWAQALSWPRDAGALGWKASYEAYFVTVASERLPWEALAGDDVSDARARALRQRMAGMQLGAAVRAGRVGSADAITQAAAVSEDALRGLGLAMVEPCADPAGVNLLLDALPEAQARALGQGAAAALGACAARGGLQATVDRLRGEGSCRLCAAAGAALLDACDANRERDLVKVGRCLSARAAAFPEREALIRGAGLFFQRPTRPARELEAITAGLGEDAATFREGADDPLGGGMGAGEGR